MCWDPMREPTPNGSHCHNTTFSLVQGGPSYYIQQKLGLIPRRGLGVPRRILFFILLTWAPIMAWAIVSQRLFPRHCDGTIVATLRRPRALPHGDPTVDRGRGHCGGNQLADLSILPDLRHRDRGLGIPIR